MNNLKSIIYNVNTGSHMNHLAHVENPYKVTHYPLYRLEVIFLTTVKSQRKQPDVS